MDMNSEPVLKRPETNDKEENKPKKTYKKKTIQRIESFPAAMEQAGQISLDDPKAFDTFVELFEAIRGLRDLSNKEITDYLDFVEGRIGDLWVSFMTKLTAHICMKASTHDSKIIPVILSKCVIILERYGIQNGILTEAQKKTCLLCDGKYVTQFLHEAQIQNKKNDLQISNADFARISFICFTLYCRYSYEGNTKIQMEIDRAIAEYFSAQEISGVREKDMAGKMVAGALAGKVYSAKKVAALTYLYVGTTAKIQEQQERIRSLDEIRRNQAERINSLNDEIRGLKTRNLDLHEKIGILQDQAQQLSEERDAAENMLDYEKNKYEKQLDAQGADLAAQLMYDIGLEVEAIRGLVDRLDPNNQRRFLRRLDRMEQYLREFGGEE